MNIKQIIHNTVVLTINYTKMLARDKMNMFWFLVFPLVMALLFGYLVPNVGGASEMVVYSENKESQVAKELLEMYSFAKEEESEEHLLEQFENGYIKVLFKVKNEGVDVCYIASQEKLVQSIVNHMQSQGVVHINTYRNDDITMIRPIDYIIPGVIVLTFMQIGLFGGVNVIDERKKNILRRLKVNNVKPVSIILAHLFSRMSIMIFAAVEIVLVGKYILGVPLMFDSVGYLLLAIIIGGTTFLSLGLFLSSIISNVETANIISQSLNFPMAFIGGIFMPIEVLPKFIIPIANILPITPLVSIFRGLLLEGMTVAVYWQNLLVLIPWLIITLVLSSVLFKWG